MLLWLVSLIAVAMVIPYLLEYLEGLVDPSLIPVSKSVFILTTILQACIFTGLSLLAGRWFASRMNYVVFPEFERRYFYSSLILGLLTGLILLGVDYVFHTGGIIPTFFSINPPAIWKSLLACFYGGIVEEILMRLFLVSMLAYIINLVAGRKSGNRKERAGIFASMIVAGIFGLAHIPVMGMITELTPAIITRVIILNSTGGIIYGYLYIRRGLLYAMVAHFTADIVLQVIFPLIYFRP